MDYLLLFLGVPALVSGTGMFLFPHARRIAAERRVLNRKEQLASGAPETFFEELRTLDAYPLATTDGKWRTKGALQMICGIILIVLAFVR